MKSETKQRVSGLLEKEKEKERSEDSESNDEDNNI